MVDCLSKDGRVSLTVRDDGQQPPDGGQLPACPATEHPDCQEEL